jgi:HTH-type transcriptional regulator/antitoxin HipB
MSFMQDIIRLPQDLGKAVKNARKELRLKTTDVAKRSGRSRDVLHRLERGDDVTVSSLMAILATMGLVLRVERAGLPTLQEMTERFSNLDDDDDAP